jgi:hypothetical protein
VSITATTSRVHSTGGEIDVTDELNTAGIDGSAATVVHMSAQVIPNDFAGQQGHFGACPSWLIDEWQ